jgi:hypothetical protein
MFIRFALPLLYAFALLGTAATNSSSIEPCSVPDSFRISLFGSSDQANITAGEPLVLAWLRPSTSTVRGITRLSFVNASGTHQPLRRVGKLPSFSSGSSSDRAGGVLVKPFLNSEPGTYVVRLSLDIPGSNCYLDTPAFSVVANIMSCVKGSKECTSQQAYRRCGVDGWKPEELCPFLCQNGTCI